MFLSGHEKEPLGLFVSHKQTPPKSFWTASQGWGVPSVLDTRWILRQGQAPKNWLLRYHANCIGEPWEIFFKKIVKQSPWMVGSFSSTNKRGKARAAAHLRVTKNPRKRKERFGCGMQFSEGHSRIFLLKGGWWLSRMNIPNQTWLLPKSRVQRWGYAKQHPQSILQHFSNSVINKQQQASKIWPLHLKRWSS